jgi:hypothetical protein
MTARSAPRLSRRCFLRFGAAAAAALALPLLDVSRNVPGLSLLRVKSALPRQGYEFLPFPERLLRAPLDNIDAALVPAYVAARLIQAGRLQPLHGPSGRPHDPEGRFTVPFAYRVAALRFPGELAAPRAAAWADLWSAAGRAVWPAFGRLITGAALLRRGFSPNETHPGHLGQAADDLERLNPRIVPEVSERFKALHRADKPLALVLADPADVEQSSSLRLPAEGTMLIEYDWVITASPALAAAARLFIDGLRPTAQSLRSDLPVRLIPLMPLPQAAQAQHDEIWASLTARQAALAA